MLCLTVNNPSWNQWKEENGRRNYFMINIYGSMGPGRDQTRTHVSAVRLVTDCYAAR